MSANAMSIDAPRVIIADDSILIREGIRQVLREGGCEVVAVVGNITELEDALARTAQIDALVLDIRMPPTHTDEGMVMLEKLRASGSQLGVLILSMYSSPSLAIRAMTTGAGTGYLLKDRVTDGNSVVTAIKTVMTGGNVVDQEVVAQLISPTPLNPGIDDLTSRERLILQLMAEGQSNLAIATTLTISTKTVESHVGKIMDKLGIETSSVGHRRVLAVLSHLRSA
jgi:DNA-binding NarL/FixJ family response regulator